MYYAYSKQISSLNDTTPQFDPSKSECYDESKTLISGCYCHKDCAKCGFNKNPTQDTNCIACSNPLFKIENGTTGMCVPDQSKKP